MNVRRIQRYNSIETFLYATGVQLPKAAFGLPSRLLRGELNQPIHLSNEHRISPPKFI